MHATVFLMKVAWQMALPSQHPVKLVVARPEICTVLFTSVKNCNTLSTEVKIHKPEPSGLVLFCESIQRIYDLYN